MGLCRLQSRSFRNIVENRAEKSALFFRAQHFESVGANTLRYGRNLKCWELKVLGEFVKNLTQNFFKKSIDKHNNLCYNKYNKRKRGTPL